MGYKDFLGDTTVEEKDAQKNLNNKLTNAPGENETGKPFDAEKNLDTKQNATSTNAENIKSATEKVTAENVENTTKEAGEKPVQSAESDAGNGTTQVAKNNKTQSTENGENATAESAVSAKNGATEESAKNAVAKSGAEAGTESGAEGVEENLTTQSMATAENTESATNVGSATKNSESEPTVDAESVQGAESSVRTENGATVNAESVQSAESDATASAKSVQSAESGAGNNTTPVAENSTTPVAENNTAPVVENNNTPVVENNTTPVAENSTVPVVENNTTPVVENSTAPVAENNVGTGSVEGVENIVEESKKSKFKFPGIMGTASGPTASLADIEKLEDDATKQAKSKGKQQNKEDSTENAETKPTENAETKPTEDVEDEIIEEEVVEEEVADEDSASEGVPDSTKDGVTVSADEQNAETIGSGTDVEQIKPQSGMIAGALLESEEERAKRIEEDEKRKSKFVLFPKKTSDTGAVFGAGFDKEKIKDSSRSIRFRAGEPEQTEADIENEIKKPKPLWLKITIAVVAVVIACGAIFGAYLGYLQSGHERIYDYKFLQIVNKNKNNTVMLDTTLDCITYNMSYGIMDPDFTYFRAENKMANGNSTKGGSSRATSKERVIINANGSAELVGKGVNSSVDFILFQNIDVDSTRSYYVDQKTILAESLSTMAGVFAEAGKSNYVFSPISSPLGRTDSRMATFSNKYIGHRIRYSLPSNSEFMSKYGTNDNCVILTRVRTASNKMLSIINVNVDIYENEDIRQKDLEAILRIMDFEHNTMGNYCLVGGTFGFLLNGTSGAFLNNMQSPAWGKQLPESFNESVLKNIGFRITSDEIALDQGIGTVRDMSVAYNKGGSYEAIVDGFIVSKDISVEKTAVIDNGYLYSSHNPVKITFRLLR